MSRRYYSSVARRTTLTSPISSAATTLSLTAATGLPTNVPFTIIIDKDTVSEEICEVTFRSGVNCTVTRGVDGSAAISHSAGAVVAHGWSQRDFDEPNAFINGTGYISPTLVDAKGDLIVATSNDIVAKVTVGTDGLPLKADSSAAAGVSWGAIPESSVTNLVSDLALKADIISETTTDYALSSNVLTMDLAAGNVAYLTTSPTAAMTFNFTNAPTTNGKSVTVSVFVVQGATGYIPSVVQVAGSAQTIKWQGGVTPTPTSTSGKIDVFSFTLIRRSSAWTVLGSLLAGF